MGYYTEYSLEVRKVKNDERFKELVNELKELEVINYALDEGWYDPNNKTACFTCYDSVKWYDHPEHMVHIAEKFPEMYFELSGVGEEFGDFWKEYYHDMDVETCRGEIVYEQPHKTMWNELIPF